MWSDIRRGRPPMTPAAYPLSVPSCVLRGTHLQKGRTCSLSPAAAAASVRHLHYGRIILDGGEPLHFSTGERETGFVCLRGQGQIQVGAERFELTPYDAL